MKTTRTSTWYSVPEVWMILILLGGMVIGSLALLATAVRHPDELLSSPRPVASPLPPSTATRPSDDATP